jgi:hypothetical protein
VALHCAPQMTCLQILLHGCRVGMHDCRSAGQQLQPWAPALSPCCCRTLLWHQGAAKALDASCTLQCMGVVHRCVVWWGACGAGVTLRLCCSARARVDCKLCCSARCTALLMLLCVAAAQLLCVLPSAAALCCCGGSSSSLLCRCFGSAAARARAWTASSAAARDARRC